jgi:hypothetical protein
MIVGDGESHSGSLTTTDRTFATLADDIDVRIHNEFVALDQQSRARFSKMFEKSDAPRSRGNSRCSSRASRQINHCPLTPGEIASYADRVMRGKRIALTDSHSAAAIVQELDQRRIEALGRSKYLEAKAFTDAINALKVRLYAADREKLHKDNQLQLEDRHRDALEACDSVVEQWQDKEREFTDSCKAECAALQQRHEAEDAELEAVWSDPATQRKFAKRSSQLLQQKTIERYMVLAGRLEAAEEIRRMNQKVEEGETRMKYQDMSDSFEAAREKLIDEHRDQLDRLKADLDFRRMNFEKERMSAMEVCEKRIATTKRNLEEQSDQEKFMAKKFKRPASKVVSLRVIDATEDLPLLACAKAVSRGDSHVSVVDDKIRTPLPLRLPDLKIKPRRKRKMNSPCR